MIRMVLILTGMSLALLGLAGCGNDGGATAAKQQQKTATITFSTVSSAHTAPLEGIQLKTVLPAGATVSNILSALTGTNDTGRVIASSYLDTPPTASFSVGPAGSSPIKFGSFAKLKCDVASGVTLEPASFTVLTSDLLLFGKDSDGNSVDLVGQIPVTVTVTFGY